MVLVNKRKREGSPDAPSAKRVKVSTVCLGVDGQICPYNSVVHRNSTTSRCKPCDIAYGSQHANTLTRTCNKCNEVKVLTQFSKSKSCVFGVATVCKACNAVCTRMRRETLRGYLMDKVKDCEATTKRRKNKGRDHAFDLSYDDLIALWHQQQGRCYYSGMLLEHKPNSNWQVSPERLNDCRGYVKDNVRLVCLEFNNRTKWTSDKMKYAFLTPHHVDTKTVQRLAHEALQKRRWNNKFSGRPDRFLRTKQADDGSTMYECRKCDTFLPRDAFHKHVNKGCKRCQRASHQAYRQTLRGKLNTLLKHAQSHTKERRSKSTQQHRDDGTCELTHDDLVEIYRKQNGQCYYSGVTLTTHGDWCMSLERLNPLKSYTISNSVLVCLEFNGTDHRARHGDLSKGSGHWNKQKFKAVQRHMQHQAVPRSETQTDAKGFMLEPAL